MMLMAGTSREERVAREKNYLIHIYTRWQVIGTKLNAASQYSSSGAFLNSPELLGDVMQS